MPSSSDVLNLYLFDIKSYLENFATISSDVIILYHVVQNLYHVVHNSYHLDMIFWL